jgi:hypothetical protein
MQPQTPEHFRTYPDEDAFSRPTTPPAEPEVDMPHLASRAERKARMRAHNKACIANGRHDLILTWAQMRVSGDHHVVAEVSRKLRTAAQEPTPRGHGKSQFIYEDK